MCGVELDHAADVLADLREERVSPFGSPIPGPLAPAMDAVKSEWSGADLDLRADRLLRRLAALDLDDRTRP